MKKIGAFLLAVITICLFTGCTFQIGNSVLLGTYYATPDEAYARDVITPATLDSKAIAPVDDTHAIWIAQDKENTIYILEMLTKDGKYHFAGNEKKFGLEDLLTEKDTEEDYIALANSDAKLYFCFSRHDNADGYQVVPFAEDGGLTIYFKYKLG